jgi:feruloyl esterase
MMKTMYRALKRCRIRSTPVLLSMLGCVTALAIGSPCESLASFAMPHTTITSSQMVAAGEFAPPGGGRGTAKGATAFKELPAFCRVAATLKPTDDSEIRIEVWLPQSGWNGKLQSVGNGALAGVISYPALAAALTAGYAGASTDSGHQGNNADFIPGHPEKLVDFAYRAPHEMTIAAKGIVREYYARAPKFSYWNGCSTGGRQAMVEVQRFPNDYDGVIAGDPVGFTTHIQAAQLWFWQIAHEKDAANFTPEKYELLHNAVVQACDALDGVRDGVLEDPTRCKFDPKSLACKDGDGPSCLTAAQVEYVKKSYTGPVNSLTGEQIYPGRTRGSELGWVTHSGPEPSSYAVDIYRHTVFHNPEWDYRTFDLDRDVAFADRVAAATMNSVNPDLTLFFSHGGKLLQYHGWSDPGVAPLGSVNYYNAVAAVMGGANKGIDKVKDSYRLFMVPGMGHCGSGDGTSSFDMVSALDQWIAKGKAPERIEAARVRNRIVDRTRPLCPYPQVATYTGSGSTDLAASFVCKAP